MMRYIAAGLVLAILAGYLLLPADKRSRLESSAAGLSAETKQLLEGYCGDMIELPREYIISLIRKTFPEYPDEGVCGLIRGRTADDALN